MKQILLNARTGSLEQALPLYEDLARGKWQSLAWVFRYAGAPSRARSVPLAPPPATAKAVRPKGDVGVAFLGAGAYARGVLLPAVTLRREVRRVALVTTTGASSRRAAERFGFATCATDPETALADLSVDLVFVATRHDSHADLATRALRAGKAVWLEKPVGLTPEEVDAVVAAARETAGFLALGYNRRFSPHARAVRSGRQARIEP